jgi:hypothetical protein
MHLEELKNLVGTDRQKKVPHIMHFCSGAEIIVFLLEKLY